MMAVTTSPPDPLARKEKARGAGKKNRYYAVVVNAKGEPAAISHLLVRWAIVWLPLFLPMSLVALLIPGAEVVAFISALLLLLLWIGAAAYTVVHPNRGLHDRIAGTWVVRR